MRTHLIRDPCESTQNQSFTQKLLEFQKKKVLSEAIKLGIAYTAQEEFADEFEESRRRA